MALTMEPIGHARTPYRDWAPHQPLAREGEKGAFRIVLNDDYEDFLFELGRFSHLIVVSYLHQVTSAVAGRVSPPWAHGREVGLFASRSPSRPCPLGISVVSLFEIQGATVFTSPLDLLDRTPVLDLKPYIPDLDSKEDASSGWIEDLDDYKHVLEHLRGAPHDHGHHDHGHHDHGHHPDHSDGVGGDDG